MTTFATHKIEDYKKTKEWCHFKLLKKARNDQVHASSQATTFSFENKVQYLNICKTGIAGLLILFRRYSECSQNIGFIQRLLTAPDVQYNN